MSTEQITATNIEESLTPGADAWQVRVDRERRERKEAYKYSPVPSPGTTVVS